MPPRSSRGPPFVYGSPQLYSKRRDDRYQVNVTTVRDNKPFYTGISSPRKLPRINKLMPIQEPQRLAEIYRSNCLLEKRMDGIYNRKELYTLNDYGLRRWNENNTQMFRDRQYSKTQKENERLEKRLRDIKPFYRAEDWAKSYAAHEKFIQHRMNRYNVNLSSPRSSRSVYYETPRDNKKTSKNPAAGELDKKGEKRTEDTEQEESDEDSVKERSRRRQKNPDTE